MPETLPINLVVAGRRCVVIGAGAVAEGRVQQLASRGARVTVVSPELTPEVEAMAAAGTIDVVRRPYEPGDLDGAFFAVSGTDDRAVNEAVWREATERGVIVNCVDDPSHCSAYFASIVQRGSLQISISTDGHAPALAVRIREELEDRFGPEYATLLDLFEEIRPEITGRATAADRKRVWYEIVDSPALDLVRSGRVDDARRAIRERVSTL